jgi:hypothetical protein
MQHISKLVIFGILLFNGISSISAIGKKSPDKIPMHYEYGYMFWRPQKVC